MHKKIIDTLNTLLEMINMFNRNSEIELLRNPNDSFLDNIKEVWTNYNSSKEISEMMVEEPHSITMEDILYHEDV